MTGDELIAGLWRREPEALSRVLQNARFEGFGGVAYGTESVRDALRAHAPDEAGVEAVASPTLAAAFGSDAHGRPAALVADLHAGWVTRLWRLGEVQGGDAGPTPVAVPADLDLDQRGGRVAFDPAAHGDLATDHAGAVLDFAEAWLWAPPAGVAGRLARVRPLVLRAASDGPRAAVLVRLEGASGRGLAGVYAAALLDRGAAAHAVVDAAGLEAALAAPWVPRLR